MVSLFITSLLDASTAGPVPYLVGLDDPEIGASFLASLEAAYREHSRLREAELVKRHSSKRVPDQNCNGEQPP